MPCGPYTEPYQPWGNGQVFEGERMPTTRVKADFGSTSQFVWTSTKSMRKHIVERPLPLFGKQPAGRPGQPRGAAKGSALPRLSLPGTRFELSAVDIMKKGSSSCGRLSASATVGVGSRGNPWLLRRTGQTVRHGTMSPMVFLLHQSTWYHLHLHPSP